MIEEVWHPRRTYLDFDGPFPRHFIQQLRAVANITELRVRWLRIDRTRHGWHVVIHWNIRLEPAEQVALQLALGSDRRRECLNLKRVLSLNRHWSKTGAKYWNLLFSRKLKR